MQILEESGLGPLFGMSGSGFALQEPLFAFGSFEYSSAGLVQKGACGFRMEATKLGRWMYMFLGSRYGFQWF